MFGAPQPTPYDVRFVLFRIPVSISPFFWIIGSFLAYSFVHDSRNHHLDPIAFVVALLAILVSILAHELGHALVIRHVFGASTAIILHGLGGVSIHDRPYYYRTPQRLGRIFISFAGPLAGFVLSGACLGCLILFEVHELAGGNSYPGIFLRVLFLIGVFWGILNLMPVYPLDGGKIFREICLWVSPRHGMEVSAGISVVVAVLIAWLFLQRQEPFLTILFAVLAWQSIQALQTRRF